VKTTSKTLLPAELEAQFKEHLKTLPAEQHKHFKAWVRRARRRGLKGQKLQPTHRIVHFFVTKPKQKSTKVVARLVKI